MRAPDMPTGWPRLIAPPSTLTLSWLISSSLADWMPTWAKASLSSTRSRSAGVRPSFASAFLMACAGWLCSEASGPATLPLAPISARTSRPRDSAFSLLMTTRAQAPSEICEAEPALMVPSAAKAGRSFASVSAVVPGRTPSSSLTTIGSPLRCVIDTGTISCSKRPSFMAAAASSWLRAENSSCSSRLMPSFLP